MLGFPADDSAPQYYEFSPRFPLSTFAGPDSVHIPPAATMVYILLVGAGGGGGGAFYDGNPATQRSGGSGYMGSSVTLLIPRQLCPDILAVELGMGGFGRPVSGSTGSAGGDGTPTILFGGNNLTELFQAPGGGGGGGASSGVAGAAGVAATVPSDTPFSNLAFWDFSATPGWLVSSQFGYPSAFTFHRRPLFLFRASSGPMFSTTTPSGNFPFAGGGAGGQPTVIPGYNGGHGYALISWW